MKVLNKYQKIQIILLILIIIAFVVLSISIYKSKNNKNYYNTKETYSDVNDKIDSTQNELEENIQNIEAIDEEINEEDTSWDEPVEESSEVDLNKEENSNKNNSATYYIKINYTANVVTVYKKDGNGEYTVPVKALVCSTGKATPTSGVYKMSSKYRWHTLNGGVRGQYCSRITGHILFHSVPYLRQSPDSLEYWAYDKLGTKASAGCIRLTVAGAQWIYNNCESGTYVEFYSSSDPGPLGKPSSQKISSNEQCRNWDPTDPDPANPWRNYVESAIAPVEQTQQQDITKETTNQIEIKEENTSKEEIKQEEKNKSNDTDKKPQENEKEKENEKDKNEQEKKEDNDKTEEIDTKQNKDMTDNESTEEIKIDTKTDTKNFL